MINKQAANYCKNRSFYPVDPNAAIQAGMVAFLGVDASGTTVATVAASGTVPIGTFWKDSDTGWFRSTLEQHTFDANDQVTLKHATVINGSVKVTDATGAVEYTDGTDYAVNTVNGIITIAAGSTIGAGDTVIVWYIYEIPASQTIWNGGTNMDRQPNDTLGSGNITVVEGWAHIFTDAYDTTQTYAVGDRLRPDAHSVWTSAVNAHPICGTVIAVPTPASPWLGIQQEIGT